MMRSSALRGGAVIKVNVTDGEGIRSIGREVYRERAGRMPSDAELKAFEEDTARRNHLTTRYSRDHIKSGTDLLVQVPAGARRPNVVAETKPARAAVVPNVVAETKPVRAAIVPSVVAETKAARPAVHPTLARPFACSGTVEDVNMVARWVTHNEAGGQSYTAYNPDDQGHGISVGLMQWNQKRGKLPDLLRAWHHKNPSKFDGMFGNHSDDVLGNSFVKDADFNGNSTLRNGMQRALNDSEFQQVQLNLRNAHIEDSCEIARDNHFTSLRGRAIVADLVNQIGPGGTRRILSKVPQAKNESGRIERLKDITDGRTNGVDRVSSIEGKVKEIWRQGK